MSRTITTVSLNCSQGEALAKASQILSNDGFTEGVDGQRGVWGKGNGMSPTGIQRIQIEWTDPVVISGWIVSFGSEQSLEGFAGMLGKKPTKATMDKVINALSA